MINCCAIVVQSDFAIHLWCVSERERSFFSVIKGTIWDGDGMGDGLLQLVTSWSFVKATFKSFLDDVVFLYVWFSPLF
jgi:hypothetical protein